MRSEDEIQEVADKAADAAQEPTKFATMTWEEGVRDALDWVLENREEPLLEP
jgi:hypothetical protein